MGWGAALALNVAASSSPRGGVKAARQTAGLCGCTAPQHCCVCRVGKLLWLTQLWLCFPPSLILFVTFFFFFTIIPFGAIFFI